jgi:hypothetical protein
MTRFDDQRGLRGWEARLQINLGPRPDIARAFAPRAREDSTPGTTSVPKGVVTFYEQTRRKFRPWPYSIVCVIAPLAVLLSAFTLANWLLPEALWTPAVQPQQMAQELLSRLCKDTELLDQQQTAVVSATIRYTATYVALLTICLVTIGTSAVCTKNVLDTHNVFRPGLLGAARRWKPRTRKVACQIASWVFSLVLPAVAGFVLFLLSWRLFGNHITQMFGANLDEILSKQPCGEEGHAVQVIAGASTLNKSLIYLGEISTCFVLIGVTSVILAAAVLAFRFETPKINGNWSLPYVLRSKLHSLLMLFFLGSVMFVSMSIAIDSRFDWLGDILSQFTNSITALRRSVIDFYGGVGSLILIVIFVPAFFKHTGEIDFAGACQGYYEALIEEIAKKNRPEADLQQPMLVASWDTIQHWKDKYGLTLSYTNMTGSFVAVLAPLLSNSLIDLAKFIPSFGK